MKILLLWIFTLTHFWVLNAQQLQSNADISDKISSDSIFVVKADTTYAKHAEHGTGKNNYIFSAGYYFRYERIKSLPSTVVTLYNINCRVFYHFCCI